MKTKITLLALHVFFIQPLFISSLNAQTPCVTPTGLTATQITQTGGTLYLSPTSANTGTFNIQYHAAGVTTLTSVHNVTLPYTLANLTCGTAYECQVQQVCSANAGAVNNSSWSTASTFTTLACVTPCNTPTGLTATQITQTGSTLYLSPTSANTGTFNIQYHAANVTTLTTVNNVTLPYTLANLTCGTTYSCQVQQVCPNGTAPNNVSGWSTASTFTTLACTTPCNAPTGLTATQITQTGGTLYLSPTSANTGTFNIQYHAAGVTTLTSVHNVTLPYTLANLTCGTAYECQVQQVCSANAGAVNNSSWSTASTFTTLACATPCNTPTGLTATQITQTGGTLYLSPTSANTGTFNIQYHAAGVTTLTTVNNVTLPYTLANLTCGTAYECQVQQICTGITTPATVSGWSTASTFTTLACATPCNTPTGLTATQITQTGSTLYLSPTSANTGTFNIQYHAAGVTTLTTVNNVTLPYTLANLTCGTAYECQVQQICTGITTPATVSGWSTASTFTTLACATPCNTPTGLTATQITQTGSTLYLSPTSANTGTFNIQYHAAGVTTLTTVNNVTLPYTLANLTCGTAYECQVQQICTGITTPATVSGWSTASTFTTLACATPCNTPTGLTATQITQTGGTLYLSPTSANTGTFNIQYHAAGVTTLTTVNNVTLPYTLANLTCGTAYECQVQQICTGITTPATVSGWSTASTFTTLACATPCNTPTGLTATQITQTGGTLYLSPTSANTGTFNIQYHAAGVTTLTTVNNVTLPYTLANLTCGTTYECQVQQVCTGITTPATVSSWSTASTFTTLACTTPCTTPTGLTATQITQTGSTLYLSPTSANTGTFNIQYHAANVTTLTTVNNVTLPYTLANLTCGTTYSCQVQQVCPNGTAPNNVSGWSTASTFTTLACATPCVTPTGLTATQITQTGGTLYLSPTSANTGTFNIQYHAAGVTTLTTVNNVTLPYTLANLTCGTAYECQVQQVCPNGTAPNNVSGWSIASTFTTLACATPCNTPTGLTATQITQTGSTLYLSPTSTNVGTFNIQYHAAGVTTLTTVHNVTLPYTLANLTCGTAYECQVQQICTGITTPATVSGWSTASTFTTLACVTPCNTPTGLTVVHVNQNSANLTWTNVSGAVGYIVSYKKVNTTNPYTIVTSSTNSITISGLTAGTDYQWQVQTICSTVAGASSALSAVAYFTTPMLLIYPNPANSSFTVNYTISTPVNTTISLYNIYGQMVYTETDSCQVGINSATISTANLTNGMYFVVIQNNTTTVHNVLVQH